jgi:NADPH:quinone reductase
MRAVLIQDRDVTVGSAPDPSPGPDDVLVAVSAAGLNPADLQQVQGRYPAPPGWPEDIPGMELSGRVLQLGGRVSGWSVGERVMALIGGGAQSERVVVPSSSLIAVPDGIDDQTAAGFPEAYSTAWDALLSQAQLRPGERVLITGATGGVGTAAIQIASFAGADVVASARRSAAHEQLTSLAENVIAVSPQDEQRAGPFDVVLELVGGPESLERVRLLNNRGRIVVIGISAGAHANVPLGALMRIRGRISASTLRARPQSEKAILAAEIAHHLVPALARGRLGVPVDSVFPLAEAAQAYARLAETGRFGKVLLTI